MVISLEREYGSTTSRGRENVGGRGDGGKREMRIFEGWTGRLAGSEKRLIDRGEKKTLDKGARKWRNRLDENHSSQAAEPGS
jgi:hypothetical protein